MIAEEQLSQAQKVSGHPLEVLRLIANKNETDANVQQAAAVHFKNIVKKGWNEDAEVRYSLMSMIHYYAFNSL